MSNDYTAKEFFQQYPLRNPESNKFDNGVIALIAGSAGMAGACSLNILGARLIGASYIHVVLPKEIYPIVAGKEPTCVYHFDDGGKLTTEVIPSGLFKKVKAMSFGSGLTNLSFKEVYLKSLLNLELPLVVDAEGLRILAKDPYLLHSHRYPLILTPHLGEFSALTNLTVDKISQDKEKIAVEYAKDNQVYLILKGHETLVISPKGELYTNHSGNSALARAGSGDLLTGMITGMLGINSDIFTALKAAVWLHGYLADEAIKTHSIELFDFADLYPLADKFFWNRQK